MEAFVGPSVSEAPEVDLSEETLEIVSHIEDALTTKPRALAAEEESDSYGDLAPELRKERAEVERRFLAAKPDEKHYDNHSGALSDPDRAFLVGTNGVMSFAFQCLSAEGDEPLEKRNPAYGYKCACGSLERAALLSAERHAIKHCARPQQKMTEFQALGQVDPSLLPVIKELGPLLSEQMRRGEKGGGDAAKMRVQKRQQFSDVQRAEVSLVEEAPVFSTKRGVAFRLMACKTPRAAPTDKKRSQWRDCDCVFECVPNTIPAAAFSDTRLAVLFQPVCEKQRGLLTLRVYEIGKWRAPAHERHFYFPESFSREGMLCTALAEDGTYAVSLGGSALVLASPPFTLALTQRRITSLTIASSGNIHLGTDVGESYVVRGDGGRAVDYTPAVEPVFATLERNGHRFVQTVMGITLVRDTPVFLELDRPLAFDVCGTLLFVMTKYGGLKVFKTDVRSVMHASPPFEQEQRPAQHAYRGLRAFPEHVVCLYPNGVVRRITLVREGK